MALPHSMRLLFPMFAIFALLAAACAQDEAPVKAPNFPSDAKWIDTGAAGQKVPRTIEGYRGHVLLIDFWEYTCINCIRDFGVVKRWYAKYHADGFDVVGVHYGEFAMGFNENNVRDAAKRFHLPWPVIADIHGSIWHAYDSDVWPNRYLIDRKGNIVLHVEGEGNNQPMENKIRQLLASTHPDVNEIPLDPPEDTFAPSCGIPTEETYVGDWFGRGSIANPNAYARDDKASDFHSKGEPADGQVMLSAGWITRQDGVSSDDTHGEAQLRYHARSVYAVLSVENPKKPVRVYLLQDGKPLGKNEAATDVQIDSEGSYLEVSSPRMYYLVTNPTFGSHLLVLKPQAPGFGLHSFTYGNNCQQNFQTM